MLQKQNAAEAEMMNNEVEQVKVCALSFADLHIIVRLAATILFNIKRFRLHEVAIPWLLRC